EFVAVEDFEDGVGVTGLRECVDQEPVADIAAGLLPFALAEIIDDGFGAGGAFFGGDNIKHDGHGVSSLRAAEVFILAGTFAELLVKGYADVGGQLCVLLLV